MNKTAFLMVMLPLSACYGQLPDKKELPEVQVKTILNRDTAFPDSLYDLMDWNTFEQLAAIKEKIELHSVDWNLLNASVFYFSNQYRTDKGKNPLHFSSALRDASVFHSLEMINRNFFDHINNGNRKMKTPFDRAKYFGYQDEIVGENINEEFIAFSQSDALTTLTYLELGKATVQRWIDSPPHRKNLLNKEYKYLGCGVVIDFDSIKKVKLPKAIATQVFGG